MSNLIEDLLSSPFIFALIVIITLIIIVLIVYDKTEGKFVNIGKICVYAYITTLGLIFTRDYFNNMVEKSDNDTFNKAQVVPNPVSLDFNNI